MSRFCGKCDFCDWLSDQSDDFIKRSNYYIRFKGRRHRIEINSRFDAIKYYPYLVSIGAHNQENDTVELCADSYIDTEERERIELRLKEVLKYRDKYKENYIEKLKQDRSYDKLIELIISEVEKYGKKAECKNVHTDIHEYYRKEWFDHMVEQGYNRQEAFCWVYKEFGCTEDKINDRLKHTENN